MKPVREWVGWRTSEPRPCWLLVRAVLDARGFPPWQPGDAVADWSPGDPIEQAAAPDWWTRLDLAEVVAGDVLVLRDERGVDAHCGLVAEGGWALHYQPSMGAMLVPMRALHRARRIVSAWRPTR